MYVIVITSKNTNPYATMLADNVAYLAADLFNHCIGVQDERSTDKLSAAFKREGYAVISCCDDEQMDYVLSRIAKIKTLDGYGFELKVVNTEVPLF